MKEANVRYQNQGDYQLPCIEIKEHNELHIGVWANRHRQYLKQHHWTIVNKVDRKNRKIK